MLPEGAGSAAMRRIVVDRVDQAAGAVELLDAVVDVADPEVAARVPGEIERERRVGEVREGSGRGIDLLDLGGEDHADVDLSVRPHRGIVRVGAHVIVADQAAAGIEVDHLGAVGQRNPEAAIVRVETESLRREIIAGSR